MSKVEFAQDWFGIDPAHYDSLERFLWRSHAHGLFHYDPEEPEQRSTKYEKSKPLKVRLAPNGTIIIKSPMIRRQNKMYEKEGSWHWESEFYTPALSKLGARRISILSMLLIVVSVYQSNVFKQLNLKRIMRARTIRPEFLALWHNFLRHGIKACKIQIERPKAEFGCGAGKHSDRYFEPVGSLESFWRPRCFRVIADGIRSLAETGDKYPAWELPKPDPLPEPDPPPKPSPLPVIDSEGDISPPSEFDWMFNP